jgi:PAS domain S-box-containing protein
MIAKSVKNSDILKYLKTTLNLMNQGCIIYDKKWNYIYINKASERIIEFPREKLIDKNLFKIFPQHKNSVFHKKAKEAIRKNSESTYEYYSPHLSKWLRITVLPIQIGVAVIFSDITKNKRLTDNLKFLSEATKVLSSSIDYETTLNSVARIAIEYISDWCSIDMLDENDKLKQVAIAHKNPKKVVLAKKLLKIIPQDQRGTLEVIKSKKSQLIPVLTDEILKSGSLTKFQLGILKRIGIYSVLISPIVIANKGIGAISFVSAEHKRKFTKIDLDMAEELSGRAALAIQNAKLYQDARSEITERRKIEDQLRKSRDQLDVIFQNVADGITVQDSTGALVYVNETAAWMSGYKSSIDMIENPLEWMERFEICDEQGKKFNLLRLPGRRALGGEKTPEELIQFIDKKTKEKRWSIVKARPFFDEDGKVVLVINIVQDLTERKEIEERKDEFVALASHELKTPVTSLKMYANLLERKLAKDKEAKELVVRIERQIDRLVDLVRDLLDFSRVRKGKLDYRVRPFRIDSLVKEVADNIRKIDADHKIEIVRLSRQKVRGNKDRIGQVLINFINNAVKYSPSGKRVLIKTSKRNGHVTVSVKDFGIGISKKDQDKIFDRFFQVSQKATETFPGLGLGLYISSEIIKRHNGKIWVRSEQGKGSTFSFSLPVAGKA